MITETNHLAAAFAVLTPAQVALHPDNIRDSGRDLDALTESIADAGVLVPLIVIPTAAVPGHTFAAGVTHVAIDGNRRKRAAEKTDATLPCLIREDLASAQATISTMATTGLMRDGLTVVEQAAAFQTMLNLGLTAAKVRKTTGRTAAEINAAKTVVTLPKTLTTEAAGFDLDLLEMAALAPWQDDPEAVAALLEAKSEGQLPHAIAELERRATANRVVAAKAAELIAAGTTVLDQRPPWEGTKTEALHYLQDETGERVTEDNHQGCPGNAVFLSSYGGAEPKVQLEWYCTDPKANGHRRTSGKLSGPMTDAEKVARATLIANNKEMVAAQSVRLDFLTTAYSTKSNHKVMTEWALAKVVTRDHTYARGLHRYDDANIVGKITGTFDHIKACREASPARQTLILWAQVVSAYEAEMNKEAWQSPTVGRAEYLKHLMALGYRPCPTELIIADHTEKRTS